MDVSVVVTVRNEEKTLPHLLDSLAVQDVREVVVVDAESTDNTAAVAASYEDRMPLRLHVEACGRGEGRNIGAGMCSGKLLAFTDGDCIANAFWARRLWQAWGGKKDRVVAGRTILTGYWAFTKLHRVELPHRGQDTTWPSANLAYPRTLFERLGGFDRSFVTAEDIDLNLRAIGVGGHIHHAPDAIVYARARDSISGFLKQAYWNGYGRKQLTLKHGRLWGEYSFGAMLRLQGLWGMARMGAGALGYMAAKLKGGRR